MMVPVSFSFSSLLVIAVTVLGLALRIVTISVVPPYVDEAQLLTEAYRFQIMPFPVHLVGFGWGENVPLAFLTWVLVQLKVPGLVALRGIILFAHIVATVMLGVLVSRWFGKTVAAVCVMFASLWPWSIISGAIGFNVFLVPPLVLGAILCFERYRERERSWLLILAVILLTIACYSYQASFFWVPTIILMHWISYPRTFTIVRSTALAIAIVILTLPIALVHLHSQFGVSIPSTIGPLALPLLEYGRFTAIGSVFSQHSIIGSIANYLGNYALHFAFIFLIFNPMHSVYQQGALLGLDPNPLSYVLSLATVTMTPLYASTMAFVWDVVFIPMGIYSLVRRGPLGGTRRFLLLWLILYPIGASFVKPDVVAYTITRDIFGLPLLILLSALGCVHIGRSARRSFMHR